MAQLGAARGAQGHAAVERRQTSAVLYSEREQIDVRDLVRAEDGACVEQFTVAQRDIVGPERMVGFSNLLGEKINREGGGDRILIT